MTGPGFACCRTCYMLQTCYLLPCLLPAHGASWWHIQTRLCLPSPPLLMCCAATDGHC